MTRSAQTSSRPASGGELAILLPPSEGKAPGGGKPGWKPSSGLFGRHLSEARTLVIDALADLDGGTESILGVGGPHLQRAREVNSSLLGSATLPAWQRYTGVVWDHIDPATLSPSAMDRARRSIVVFSGLLGLVGFDDPIPNYKLKMGATLDLPMKAGGLTRQKLAAFWQPQASPILDRWLTGRTVIDLLPLEHRRAWSPSTDATILKMSFIDRHGRSVGHDAKAAKGHFVRHLLTSRSPSRAIESWEHPEYRLDVSAGA